jgi:uncharacterized protein
MKKIAVIGSGISGLGCAYALRDEFQLTVFEASSVLGGHANTVEVEVDGQRFGVDTGFLVYNERTYPRLIALFEALKVKVAPSEMSFSVSRRDTDREWCGSSISSLFAQPSNLVSLRFWLMLKDILRFNKEATQLAERVQDKTPGSAENQLDEPLSAYLKRRGYGKAFSEDYLLPMAAAIWSCPMSTMAGFPMGSFVRFFHNHGLLQVSNRPQWFTCDGGSRNYVNAIAKALTLEGHQIRTQSPVISVARGKDYCDVTTPQGLERFDGVVLACHSDQALKLLTNPSDSERKVLQAIRYQDNVAYLHTDQNLMPKRKKAWAAWNYLCDRSQGLSAAAEVSITYWLNRLQPLPFQTELFVSLNPITLPRSESIIETMAYSHPVLDSDATRAQRDISGLQGQQNTWYAGAWCGYGFHEDGLKAGLEAAENVAAHFNHKNQVAHEPLAA